MITIITITIIPLYIYIITITIASIALYITIITVTVILQTVASASLRSLQTDPRRGPAMPQMQGLSGTLSQGFGV